ncbi:hypothetical protein [Nocardia altamirensis]|nr:hypothetical protein [Nocardia altamirensis]
MKSNPTQLRPTLVRRAAVLTSMTPYFSALVTTLATVALNPKMPPGSGD